MMLIPSIWFSFVAFVVATMCNGFLSVNLEPKVSAPHCTVGYHLVMATMCDDASSQSTLSPRLVPP
jgi:hypothetical protein